MTSRGGTVPTESPGSTYASLLGSEAPGLYREPKMRMAELGGASLHKPRRDAVAQRPKSV